MEVSFELVKEISPRDLLWVASTIDDSHVLVETLEEDGEFTGERDTFRALDIHNPNYKPSADVLRDIQAGIDLGIERQRHFCADAEELAATFRALSRQ